MTATYSDLELEALLAEVESDLVERKAAFDGDVSPETFGQPGLVAYRNPNLAEAMRVSGLVQRYGVGIPRARRELHANNQEEPAFDVDAHHVRCTVRARPDWPGNVPAAPC